MPNMMVRTAWERGSQTAIGLRIVLIAATGLIVFIGAILVVGGDGLQRQSGAIALGAALLALLWLASSAPAGKRWVTRRRFQRAR